ncbi:acyltransferase family protein [Janthinobacterium sp. Mn2066]|uniref:acyltransferase family protein n=1 Tax=Janthinobacterium sp. Mn2066 TaxID=3395264 RepID=UPI003BE74DF4
MIKQKFNSIQYLRALASLMVVHCHFYEIVLGDFTSWWGGMGVDLFFVISGFVLYLSTRHNPSPRQYLINRVSRVVPTYWVMTCLLGFVLVFFPGVFKTADFTVTHFLLSLLFFPHWAPNSTTSIFPIYAIGWTLMYEWFFYISFMLFLSVKKNLVLKLFLFLSSFVVGANLILRVNDDIALVTFFSSPIILEFFVGVLIAHLYTQKKINLGMFAHSVLVLIAIVMFIVMLGYYEKFGRVICAGIPAAILVFALAGMDTIGKVRNIKLFTLIGDSSYSLYLIHPFVYGIFRFAYSRGYLDSISLVVIYFVSLFFVLVSAVVFYKYVEVPMCAAVKRVLKRKFEKQFAH